MRKFTVMMRHTIEYDVEVAANGYDEAVRVAKSLAKDKHDSNLNIASSIHGSFIQLTSKAC